MAEFSLPTAVSFGADALSVLDEFNNTVVLIITDAFMATTDFMATVKKHLSGNEIHIYDQVAPNPTTSTVVHATNAYMEVKPKVVVAVGGGSPIDTAKGVVLSAAKMGVPPVDGFMVVPTTSGSGSEVTSFAVITDEKSDSKITVVDPAMRPSHAILDPDAVRTAPRSITVDTGFDALSHAYEAILSTRASDFTDALALRAIQLIYTYLPRAAADGNDMEAREHMHNAATLAGIAFDNAGLGIVHSLSHPIGGHFEKPHGRVNSLVMPGVLRYNAGELGFGKDGLTPTGCRLAMIGEAIGLDAPTPRALAVGAIDAVDKLKAELGLPCTIADLGIAKEPFLAAIPEMAQAAMGDACTTTNPIQPTVEDLEDLYLSVAGAGRVNHSQLKTRR